MDLQRYATSRFNFIHSVTMLLFSHWVMSDSLWPQAPLSCTISQSLLRLTSIELVMPSKHLILCHPLLLLPSIFPSISVFSSESVLRIRWPEYWSFSFSISPSNEYSGLISFRIGWGEDSWDFDTDDFEPVSDMHFWMELAAIFCTGLNRKKIC